MNVNEILSTLKKVVNKQDKNDNRLLTNSKEIVGAINENKLSLEDILLNRMEWINIKELGSKGDGITDDTDIIQYALNNYKVVYFPSGDYLVTRTLNMPFGTVIKGDNPQTTKLIATMSKEFIIKYGDTYNYNGYRGLISKIMFTSNNDINNKPFGIYLNSGITIEYTDFMRIGKVLERSSSYIDMVKLQSVYVGYCVPNGEYIINLSGNADGLEINQLKVAKYLSDTSEFNGINICKCHGGSIKNSIINFNIKIDKCNAIGIENTHIESADNAPTQIKIIDSIVNIKNCFKFKNATMNDILLESTNYDMATSLSIDNTVFYIIGTTFKEFDSCSSEIGSIPINCTLNINNCYRQFNFADSNRTTMMTNGILINELDKFNVNSSELSQRCLIGAKNFIKNDLVMENYLGSVSLGTTQKSNLTTWKDIDKTNLYYRALNVIDETRKVIQGYTGFLNVSGLTKGGDGVIVALNENNIPKNGHLLLLKGEDSASYNKQCLIPIIGRCILLDNGLAVNGFLWEDRTPDNGYSGYNRPAKFYTINNGENAVIYHTTTPSLGVWKNGDRCINTNIAIGQIKAWTYNGTTWISEGTY